MKIAIPLLDGDGNAVTMIRPWGPNYVVALDAMPLFADMIGSDHVCVILTDRSARLVPEPADGYHITLRIDATGGAVSLSWEVGLNNTVYASHNYRPAVLSELAQ